MTNAGTRCTGETSESLCSAHGASRPGSGPVAPCGLPASSLGSGISTRSHRAVAQFSKEIPHVLSPVAPGVHRRLSRRSPPYAAHASVLRSNAHRQWRRRSRGRPPPTSSSRSPGADQHRHLHRAFVLDPWGLPGRRRSRRGAGWRELLLRRQQRGDQHRHLRPSTWSRRSSFIDAGTATYDLSGYLGGFAAQDDNAQLTISFLNNLGVVLGTAEIGPVLRCRSWRRPYRPPAPYDQPGAVPDRLTRSAGVSTTADDQGRRLRQRRLRRQPVPGLGVGRLPRRRLRARNRPILLPDADGSFGARLGAITWRARRTLAAA